MPVSDFDCELPALHDLEAELIGRTVVHYRISAELGRGGMGVVYKAEDIRLGRQVAVKFLPEELSDDPVARNRFLREARSASALNHPNICTVYDVGFLDGAPFIVMEWLEGQTVREQLAGGTFEISRILRYGAQIAEALDAAHSKGIIHRDIKTQNVFITRDGQAKILDFGLAKDVTPAAQDDSTGAESGATNPGTVLGTIGYMSPEQVRGEALDRRTDLFSLGIVLYEMAAGCLPFRGNNAGVIFDQILNGTPRLPTEFNPQVPYGLEMLILRALAKDRKERYQTAREVLDALRALGSDPAYRPPERTRRRESIAVLPFLNLTPGPDSDYFADGLTDDLINGLSRMEGLLVVARTSVFRFKDAAVDVREFGHRLGVQTVLEGSIRQHGSRIRVSTQLINVSDGYQLWSERYDREFSDVFEIQDEISDAIVRKLKIELSPSKLRIATYTDDIETYNTYLKGLFHFNKRNAESLPKAIGLFEEAIDRSPGYAPAYCGLATAYSMIPFHASIPPTSVMPKAKATAQKALEIDESLPQAHAALGHIQATYEWNFVEAERSLQRAIELNPGYAPAHHWYATSVLASRNRLEEAQQVLERALELDPLSLIINTSFASILDFRLEHDAAIEHYHKTLELDPQFYFAHVHLGRAYEHKQDFERAIAAFRKGCEFAGENNTFARARLGEGYAAAGLTREAIQVLEELKATRTRTYVPANSIAQIHMRLGDSDAAFEWLDRAVEERSVWLLWILPSLEYEPLKSDPRFGPLMRRIGVLDGGVQDAHTAIRAG